jgi:glycyl-tRNA synthetase beta chain
MNKKTRDLLVEIGTEELPPRALNNLAYHFAQHLQKQFCELELSASDDTCELYYSPRRLAVIIKNVGEMQPERTSERFGPAVKIAFDDSGKPTKAAEGFARSCGTNIEQLEQQDGKLFFTATEPGKPAATLIPEAIRTSLQRLPIPKRMRWGTGDIEFVRPVHWAVVLFGDEVIDCDILGITSGRVTSGHRYHHPEPIELKQPGDYVRILRKAHVWLNDREGSLKQEISSQAKRLAMDVNGQAVNAEPDSDLVAENAALVEWPVALTGSFDSKFLDLPEEVLIATLEDQQRYFAVRDQNSARLLPHFIAISNIESRQPERVREGNERVIVPRLADAMFFWESDRAVKLENRIDELEGIVFQNKLGSLGDKMRRVRSLAAFIAETTGSDDQSVMRAADLAKCDCSVTWSSNFRNCRAPLAAIWPSMTVNPGKLLQQSRNIISRVLPATHCPGQ